MLYKYKNFVKTFRNLHENLIEAKTFDIFTVTVDQTLNAATDTAQEDDLDVVALDQQDTSNSKRVRRMNSGEPYMFQRVNEQSQRQKQRELRIKILKTKSDILETAQKIVQINIVTISLLVTFLPHNTYNIILYFNYSLQSTLVYQVLGLIQLPFVMLFPILIYKKLVRKHI